MGRQRRPYMGLSWLCLACVCLSGVVAAADSDLDPTTTAGWLARGRQHMQQQQYEAAISCFEAANAREPENVDAIVATGVAMAQVGRTHGALAKFLEVLLKDKSCAAAHFNAGQAYQELNKPAKALFHYKSAATLEPDDWAVLEKLIQIYAVLDEQVELAACRQQLQQLHRRGLVPVNDFVREHFILGPFKVIATEQLIPSGRRHVHWRFFVYPKDSDRLRYTISLFSSDEANELAKRMGHLQDGERLYHLEQVASRTVTRHRSTGRRPLQRRLVASWTSEPAYAVVRTRVVEHLEAHSKEGLE